MSSPRSWKPHHYSSVPNTVSDLQQNGYSPNHNMYFLYPVVGKKFNRLPTSLQRAADRIIAHVAHDAWNSLSPKKYQHTQSTNGNVTSYTNHEGNVNVEWAYRDPKDPRSPGLVFSV